MKKKIFFCPVYLGMLKYYEKLIPYLEKNYGVGFIFLGNKKEYNDIMVEYCKRKKYEYRILEYKSNKVRNIVFYKPIVSNYLYIKRCKDLLTKICADKIIFPNNVAHRRRILVREANKKGVETIVLQWALNFVESKEVIRKNMEAKKRVKANFPKVVYSKILIVMNFLLNMDYPKSQRFFKLQNAKKIGVIDEKAKKNFVFHRYDKRNIQIVGHIDNQLISELNAKIKIDKDYKNSLYKKYLINRNRKNVIVISTSFNHKDIRILSNKEQDEYYLKIFKAIWKILLPKDYNISFKLHPSEPDVYHRCRNLGVNILQEDAKTEELVCLSDLYISYPQSTVNYMAQAIDKTSIFINFINLEIYEVAKNYYNIDKTIKAYEDFSVKLIEYKEGRMQKQYSDMKIDVKSIDNIVKFID